MTAHLPTSIFLFFVQTYQKMVFNVVILILLAVFLTNFENANGIEALNSRSHSASLTDFGGVGDGKTLNTKAFQAAIANLSQYQSNGGSILNVPAGKWLTGNFNLTSHFTLHLDKDAVLLASQDESAYAVIGPLPSYGRGRDTKGGRLISLIFGNNLTDVVITGNNGTIDGQGAPWWDKFHKGQMKYTRPYLIEIMYSDQITISNITLINAPTWNIHPVYSSHISIQGVTIIAPVTVVNTDGINPDSCNDTRIEDCYIVSGDDCVAIKSGWDQYGIAYGMPTQRVTIKRLTCISPNSAAIALGSEMSGGISDVIIEDMVAIDTEAAVRLKTSPGRGAYIKNVYVKGMNLKTMKYVFRVSGDYGEHPDDQFDPNALPVVNNINFKDITAENVTLAGKFTGIDKHPFTGICLSNVTIQMAEHGKKLPWNCSSISGISKDVVPKPCDLLPVQGIECNFQTVNQPW